MKKRKRNEMEKAQSLNGAAQELDMDALENVAGGRIESRKEKIDNYGGIKTVYDVFDDDTGELIATTNMLGEAFDRDHRQNHAVRVVGVGKISPKF